MILPILRESGLIASAKLTPAIVSTPFVVVDIVQLFMITALKLVN